MLFDDNKIRCERILIVFSALLFLLFMIGSVCASENVSCDMNIIDSYDIENNSDYVLNENDRQENDSTQDYETDGVYESTHIEYSSSCQKFTSGKIEYNVKLYDFVRYHGVRYIEPKYGSIIKLRVYTGNHYKNYQARVGDDGIAHIKIPNLNIGLHKVEIYHNNVKKGSSSIRIVKSVAKVYGPANFIKYGKTAHMRIIDSYGRAAKNVLINVNVFTGNKAKTYRIKTNNNGFASFKVNGLSYGRHKIIIKTADSRYVFHKTTKILVKKTVKKRPQRLYAIANTTTNQYKNNAYFDIHIKDCYYRAVKNLAIKVKIFTGNKYKTVTLKTNSKGIASFNTHALSIGNHKIFISNANKNYKLNKYSKVIIKANVESNKIEPTKLKQLVYSPDDYIKLTWMSKPGSTYQILKKSYGDYHIVSTVIANSENQFFMEKVDNKILATYSVRELISNGNKHIVGPWDMGGLKMITAPNVKVDFQNLKAEISWNAIEGATNYKIYRKIGFEGQYSCIATVDSSKLTYTDWYYKSPDKLSELLKKETFIDPNINNLFYTVRACKIQKVGDVQKSVIGLYLKDGDFHLEAPAIVNLKENNITWGEVLNAKGYYILKKNNENGIWEKIAEVNNTNSIIQSFEIGAIDNNTYYSVQAFSIKNGKVICSDYDKGFSLKYFTHNSTNKILFIGDSITYGSPYRYDLGDIFSFPYRVSQLTGCTFYNPSVPGSTYHDLGTNSDGSNVNSHRSIPREVVDPISIGQLPARWKKLGTAENSEGISHTKLSDYDIIVLSAGTNDYADNSKLGSISTTDTFYFNGGINHIMNVIEKASKYRVSIGLSPIKVVFMDLFYSNSKSPYYKTLNRDTSPNSIGLTLADYQKELDKQFNKWSKSDLKLFKFKTRSYNIVNANNCKYTTADNLHLTKFSYTQYGNALAKFLVENVFA